MEAEFRLHMEMRAEDLVRSGLTPAEAARRARLEFGSAESFKDRGRDARGLRWFDSLRFSMLDLKLGGRMLVKHPALTVIGTIAVAFAIAVGTVAFEIGTRSRSRRIPLPDGDAIVVLRNWHVQDNGPVGASRRDYARWKSDVTTVTDLGAIEVHDRNVAWDANAGESVTVADVTASTFAMTRVPALQGRTLLPNRRTRRRRTRHRDRIRVLAKQARWRRGRCRPCHPRQRNAHENRRRDAARLRISAAAMASGVRCISSGFPRQRLVFLRRWTSGAGPHPRRSKRRVGGDRRRDGDDVSGHTQVSALAGRLAAERGLANWPAKRRWSVGAVNVFLVMLIALVCGNVALLLFARAASRQTEIVVRTALGASRGRLITQLFAEALVLCAVGAVVGLVASRFVLRGRGRLTKGRKVRCRSGSAPRCRRRRFICDRADAVRGGHRRRRPRAQSDVGRCGRAAPRDVERRRRAAVRRRVDRHHRRADRVHDDASGA